MTVLHYNQHHNQHMTAQSEITDMSGSKQPGETYLGLHNGEWMQWKRHSARMHGGRDALYGSCTQVLQVSVGVQKGQWRRLKVQQYVLQCKTEWGDSDCDCLQTDLYTFIKNSFTSNCLEDTLKFCSEGFLQQVNKTLLWKRRLCYHTI